MDERPWLTSDVIGIIKDMRERQDFSALPILADALQEGGMPEDWPAENEDNPVKRFFKRFSILTRLREGVDEGNIRAQRVICFILGGSYWESVKWMDDFAKRMTEAAVESHWAGNFSHIPDHLKYDRLMTHAHKFLEDGHTESGPGYSWDDLFRENAHEFWQHFEVITGKVVDDWRKEDRLFSCSC